MKSFFTPKDVTGLLGLSYRQIQYWDQSGFIKPSRRRKGRYRLYATEDVIQLWVTVHLRRMGQSIQVLRFIIPALRRLLTQNHYPLEKVTIGVMEDNVLVIGGDVYSSARTSGWSFFKVSDLIEEIDRNFPEESSCAS